VSVKRVIWCLGAALASGFLAIPASGEEPPPTRLQVTAASEARSQRGANDVPAESDAAVGTGAIAAPPPSSVEQPGVAKQFVRDVLGDYKNFLSVGTAVWLGVGGGAALAVHPADEAIREDTQEGTTLSTSLKGGQYYGGAAVQVPLALGWWIVGHAVGSERGETAGRDLLRAQISAVSWTYAFKFPVNRTRPNGDPRSFPSGHASATFATAMVLEDHYGWKVGVPAFAAAVYTAASRVTDDKHWASDVVFGAFLGVASARTVTLHLRQSKVSIAPMVVPGGGGVLVSRLE
jgi:membrane-associated phospholipid phosphatase